MSVAAWCLRCTATHSRGRIPVVIQMTNRHGHGGHGMHRQGPVRERPVQVDRGDGSRELRHEEAGDDGGEEVPEHRTHDTTY